MATVVAVQSNCGRRQLPRKAQPRRLCLGLASGDKTVGLGQTWRTLRAFVAPGLACIAQDRAGVIAVLSDHAMAS